MGADNKLVWKLPADWENFRRVTKDKPFIMGRISYESEDMLYSDYKNVILSRSGIEGLPEKFVHAHSIEAGIALLTGEPEVFILGGARIFDQTLPIANYMYLTIVHATVDGDAFFPEINWEEWELTKSVPHPVDAEHEYAFSLNEYRRKPIPSGKNEHL